MTPIELDIKATFLSLVMISDFILKGKNCEEDLENVSQNPKVWENRKRSGFVFLLFILFMALWFFSSFFHNAVALSMAVALSRAAAYWGAELATSASQGCSPGSASMQSRGQPGQTPGPSDMHYFSQEAGGRVQLLVAQTSCFCGFDHSGLNRPLIWCRADNLLPSPWITSKGPFDKKKKELVVYITRASLTERGFVVTWGVFLRHPCPRSSTGEPVPSTCASAMAASPSSLSGHGLSLWSGDMRIWQHENSRQKGNSPGESLCASGICQMFDPQQKMCSLLCRAHPTQCHLKIQNGSMSQLQALDNLYLNLSPI